MIPFKSDHLNYISKGLKNCMRQFSLSCLSQPSFSAEPFLQPPISSLPSFAVLSDCAAEHYAELLEPLPFLYIYPTALKEICALCGIPPLLSCLL